MHRRALLLATAAALLAAPAFAADAPYTAPKNSLGQPDLTGTWSNATLTQQSRNPLYGTRAVALPAEVKALEGGAADKAAAGDAKSDLTKDVNQDPSNVGAYNQGWIDGGS